MGNMLHLLAVVIALLCLWCVEEVTVAGAAGPRPSGAALSCHVTHVLSAQSPFDCALALLFLYFFDHIGRCYRRLTGYV